MFGVMGCEGGTNVDGSRVLLVSESAEAVDGGCGGASVAAVRALLESLGAQSAQVLGSAIA